MYQLPYTAELLIAYVLVSQAPVTLQLLVHGLVPQTAGATLLGVLLGRQLWPAARRSTVLTAFVYSGVWLVVDLLLPEGLYEQLIDQVAAIAFVTMLWPAGPDRWLRRRFEALLRSVRRWSTGIPLHA